MSESIFTKIIKGELPCHKVYEDDHTLAILEINPIQPGHVLIIPKVQVEFLWDLPEDTYQAVMLTAKKVAIHIRQALKVKYVGSQVVGVHVPHAHLHLIPFNVVDEYYVKPKLNHQSDHLALAKMANKLKF